MNSKRVLLLDNKDGGGGGAGRYLLNLAEMLLGAGYQVDVAFLLASENTFLRDKARALGAGVHEIMDADYAPDVAAKWVRDFVDTHQVDVIHVNVGGGEMRSVIERFRQLPSGNEKRLYTLHGPLETAAALANWTLLDRLPWSKKRKKRQKLASFVQSFDEMISVSRRNADEAIHLYQLRSDRVTTVPNGVDTDLFSPPELPNGNQTSPTRPIRMGTCSRLSQLKRIDIMIAAFAKLPRTTESELYIAGKGGEEKSLRKLAEDLGVADRTHFLGHVSDIPKLLRTFDIFIMTSDREGLPYALLEAMATGLPTVVTGVNELPDIVRNDRDGFVIPADDIDACSRRLANLLNDGTLRQRMGQCARERVCEQFSQDKWQERTVAVYAKLQERP